MNEQEKGEVEQGIFLEVDEGDPFVEVEMLARDADGSGIVAGQLPAAPGRYELRRVSDDE